MNLDNRNIDLRDSNVLLQMIRNIEVPLASIIEASNESSNSSHYNRAKSNSDRTIFSSSQEIKRIINEFIDKLNSARQKEQPIIFQIYYSNVRIRSICAKEMNPKRISKQDVSWLKKVENEIFKNIKHKDLNLYNLAYEMSTSERQLHRKIKSLVHLTPNKYIRVLKLHKARKLIDDYIYDTISQISYAVGYYDTHYFSKLFHQQYGISPKELLKKRKL